MATNTQIKAQIDVDITNKTTVASITPLNVGTNMKAVVDYIDQEINDVELTPGPVGASGPMGPQGVAGPVGPAGLNWEGAWDSERTYALNDAVGYNGASWYCISPVTSGTGNDEPDTATLNWALLASQGSPGPQGPQGLPGSAVINTTANLISNTNSAPFPYSTATFAQFPSSNSYALPPTPALGEVRYIKTAFANCTLWASPNPGNDGANNNFYTPTGNGNVNMQLVAGKSYRFTYIGRYGATFGFWTVEIMNNI
jgi:hypothetical protein